MVVAMQPTSTDKASALTWAVVGMAMAGLGIYCMTLGDERAWIALACLPMVVVAAWEVVQSLSSRQQSGNTTRRTPRE